jgi:hypothetical protein
LFAHRPHQSPIENRVRIGNHLHAPPEQITIAPGLTFAALAAGKPGAPPVLAARGDLRFHLVGRLGRRHRLGACHAVAIAWSVDQFLDIVSLLRRIGAN